MNQSSKKSLTISNLTVQYEKTLILDNFTNQFGTGLHWVQGHNGSGKSTLLKSLCGIIPIPADTVKIMGYDISSESQMAKSKLCFVPDKPEVYPFMTGIQYLKFIAKIKSAEINNDLKKWIKAIKLESFENIKFSQMSYGTRRKFTLSSILIGNPDVILLDEPFNGLDKDSATALFHWLSTARKDKCILIVNHESNNVKDIVDSNIYLDAQ